MLQAIRDKAQSWIAWVIVGLIIITFALFGIEQYAQGQKVVVVAEVNGEEVTDRDFLIIYNREKNRLQQQFGEMYEQAVQDEKLRDEVLESLIQTEVMRQWAEANNMTISDGMLASTIQTAGVFQKEGKFDEATYQEVLNRNGLNVARFEYEQRQFLAERQNRQLTQASQLSTAYQEQVLVSLLYQKRFVNYLKVSKTPFIEKAEIADVAISDYYNENKQDFVVPEQMIVDYIALSQDELAKKVVVDEMALQAFYDDNQLQFINPEQRQASHILIRTDTNSDKEVVAAEEKAKAILKQIQEGVDFAELATKESQDPGSAKSGGDLGMFQQGMMVPEFDEVVFSMEVGQVSELVKTDFGYHIIKLTGIQEKQQKPFSEVSADVEHQYRTQEAERVYFDLLEQLNTIAYEQPDSLQGVADALALEIKTSEPFSRDGGKGVASSPKVITAAFSEDVKNGQNSSSIETSATESVVVRMKDSIPPRQKSLDEVKSEIKEVLAIEAAKKAAAELATELKSKIKQGAKLADLATDGVTFHEVGGVFRQNNQLLPQMTEALFKLPKPKGQAVSHQMQLITGDSVLMVMDKVEQGKMPENMNATMQADMKNTVMDIMSGAENHARVQSLIDVAKVEKFEVYKTIK